MDRRPNTHERSPRNATEADRSRQRFEGFLAKMAAMGISQQELSRKTGIGAQHICDLKKGRRRMSELVARRLGDQFGIAYGWFLGQDSPQETSPRSATMVAQAREPGLGASEGEQIVRLPVHTEPIDADPFDPGVWGGSFVSLIGPAAVAAGRGIRPYVLRLAENDHRGQLKKGDMLLVSQEPNRTQVGDLGVIRSAGRVLLAWRKSGRAWTELAADRAVDSEVNVGQCVAVVWGSLEGRWSAQPAEPQSPPSVRNTPVHGSTKTPKRRLLPKKLRPPKKPT